jgi:hypothetical protein
VPTISAIVYCFWRGAVCKKPAVYQLGLLPLGQHAPNLNSGLFCLPSEQFSDAGVLKHGQRERNWALLAGYSNRPSVPTSLRLLTNTRSSEPLAATRARNARPHASSLFRLRCVLDGLGALRFAACPCASLATSRSIASGCSLELSYKHHHPFIQPLRGTF